MKKENEHMKVINGGRRIAEGLPPSAVLQDNATPGEIAAALETWETALAELKDAKSVHDAAEREARAESIRPDRADREAEARAATKIEAETLRLAQRACTEAARKVVAAIEENADTLRRIGARLALEAHARAVDAAIDLAHAKSTFGTTAPTVEPLAHVDPVLVARTRATNYQESNLEILDRVNVAALAALAGQDPEDFGFVEVVRDRDMARIWTTRRRASGLTQTGAWSIAKEAACR